MVQGNLTVRHDVASGYWPTFVELRDDRNNPVYTLDHVTLKSVQADGNEVWIPVECSQTMATDSGTANKINYRVDVKSLKVNEPLPLEYFKLTAMPNEDVGDLDRGTEIAPASDPNWEDASRESFPFSDFHRALAGAKMADVTPAIGPIGSSPAQAIAATKAASESRNYLAIVPISIGTLLLAGALFWRRWKMA